MPKLVALSLSIAVLGAIWTWLAVGPLAGFVLVWAGFIAWGCFFHSGGDEKALTKTIVGNAYGVAVAWITLLVLVKAGLAGPVAIGIWVGVTVFFLVIVASVDLLSVVPANVYGYAATVAYSLHQPSPAGEAGAMGTGPLNSLLAPSFANPLVLLIVSMALGAVFGWISGKIAGLIGAKED
jgi:hypothetical protein